MPVLLAQELTENLGFLRQKPGTPPHITKVMTQMLYLAITFRIKAGSFARSSLSQTIIQVSSSSISSPATL
jgi:hypothetical protein